MATGVVGSVSGLWRFPVKSMGGELLETAELSMHGVVGDRAFALIDAETGKVVSAKNVRQFPELLACQAAFAAAPQLGKELPPVRISLPNGRAVSSDSGDVDRVLSSYFGRALKLARVAPHDFTIAQFHPDIEGADPSGHRDTVVDQKLGSAFFEQAGMASPVAVGAFFDLFPVSVLTTSTLAELRQLAPDSRVDSRRFRMNVIVDSIDDGFVENEWVGGAVVLGDAARLRIASPDPRCVMTTLAQDDLPADLEVLRTLVRHNRLPIAGSLFPCAGVYAVVEAAGILRTGDAVRLA